MARTDLTSIDGFEALNAKLKKLPDSVKRREVLSIMRVWARPMKKAYAAALPVKTGNLSKSVAIRTMRDSYSGGNPVVRVLPDKVGKKYDGYYRFMVIPKGVKPGSIKRDSRQGLNTVVPLARDRALKQVGQSSGEVMADKLAALVQKKINRL